MRSYWTPLNADSLPTHDYFITDNAGIRTMGKHQGLNCACEHSELLSVFLMVWAVCFFYHCKMPPKQSWPFFFFCYKMILCHTFHFHIYISINFESSMHVGILIAQGTECMNTMIQCIAQWKQLRILSWIAAGKDTCPSSIFFCLKL